MLILTRRIGEKLVVGDNVRLTILGVKGNQIRVGIEAPPEVKVHREEIYQKILADKDAPVTLRSRKTSALGKKDIPVNKNRENRSRETLALKKRSNIIGL